jgi:hypothetical protein
MDEVYMTSIQNHYHSVYLGNIKDSRPIGTQNLQELISLIRVPGQKTIDLIEQIRNETDPATKGALKTQLNAYTPCVICKNRRTYKDIFEFSGLVALDFDKLESVDIAMDLREYLFNEYPFVYASWLSSSGKGVRALVRIKKPSTVDEFKSHYHALERNYMDQYPGYDRAPQNAVLPLFQSYDSGILYRIKADEFNEVYIPPKIERYIPQVQHLVTDDDRNRAERIFIDRINLIDSAGHLILRASSFVLGGHVGAGYISQHEAENLAHVAIEQHWYLSQKQSVYKRTASQMIQKGAQMPLYFSKKSVV